MFLLAHFTGGFGSGFGCVNLAEGLGFVLGGGEGSLTGVVMRVDHLVGVGFYFCFVFAMGAVERVWSLTVGDFRSDVKCGVRWGRGVGLRGISSGLGFDGGLR